MTTYELDRKVFRVGERGLGISIPKLWSKAHDVKAGSEVQVIFDSTNELKVKLKQSSKDSKN